MLLLRHLNHTAETTALLNLTWVKVFHAVGHLAAVASFRSVTSVASGTTAETVFSTAARHTTHYADIDISTVDEGIRICILTLVG